MYTNYRHYILLFCAIITVIVSGIGYKVLYGTVVAQAKESSRVSTETALENEQKKREQDIASIYSQSSEDRTRIKSLLVSQEKIVDFLNTIEKIGTDSGASIDVSAIDTKEFSPDSPDAIGHFQVHIESKSSWSDIMQVLMLIEHMPYSSSLNNIRLTKNDDKNGIWVLSFDLRILTSK